MVNKNNNTNKQHHFVLLLLIWLCINNGSTVTYNTYASNQYQLSNDNTNINDATLDMYEYHHQQNRNNAPNVAQNQQGYANHQRQSYGYYYTLPPPSPSPPYYQQQQPHRHQQKSAIQPTTQLWSGPPIVVEDVVNRQPITSTRVFYEQQEGPKNSNTLLPALNRNSNTQTIKAAATATPTATSFNYNNNNNNNNIVYHRDFRPQIAVIPDTEHTKQQQDDESINWSYKRQQQEQQQQQQQQQQRARQLRFEMEQEERQRQREQREQQQQQPQQQFYATNTNLSFNGISSNDLTKDKTIDYREHFRRYLQNNPLRIKPIY